MNNVQADYGWKDADATCAHAYLMPAILQCLPRRSSLRILDIGCGNGHMAGALAARGHRVVGLDASQDGIALAQRNYPSVVFKLASLYDEGFEEIVGTEHDVAIACEVIEHLYWPRKLLQRAQGALATGGRLIVTTPYHGYLKNLALSLAGGWDRHFHAGWDGGHIKFFSQASLGALMEEAGFANLQFQGAGRLPWLWKSMVMTGERL